jgi:hypothetical protein
MYKVIGSDQKIYGPVTAAQIRQWQSEGRINSATLLQTEGSNDWKPLSSVSELGTPPVGTPPVVSMPAPVAVQRGNGMATAGLVFGVLSNLCCCFGVAWAVLGIIFSVVALSQHDSHPQQGGRGMALAGLILSVTGLTWRCLLPFFVGFPPGAWWMLHHHWRHW